MEKEESVGTRGGFGSALDPNPTPESVPDDVTGPDVAKLTPLTSPLTSCPSPNNPKHNKKKKCEVTVKVYLILSVSKDRDVDVNSSGRYESDMSLWRS